jgi:L-ascorbate metabolism protein UlaG (beta-lactamase superfamily)
VDTTDLPKEILEMDAPDILIVPVGDEGVLSPSDAHKLAVKLEAKIVIPILFDEKSVKIFLKEAGAEGTRAVDKLTLKAKDVSDKQNEVVILTA